MFKENQILQLGWYCSILVQKTRKTIYFGFGSKGKQSHTGKKKQLLRNVWQAPQVPTVSAFVCVLLNVLSFVREQHETR